MFSLLFKIINEYFKRKEKQMQKPEQAISQILQLIPTYKSLLSSLSSLTSISNSTLASNSTWSHKYAQLKSLYLKNIDEQLNLENYLSEEGKLKKT